MPPNDYKLPRVSRKEAIIMELLLAGDELYGLQMIRERPNDLKRGTIYVTLNRLEDKGFIKSKEIAPKEGEQGPARRVYQITGTGRRVLEAMAAASAVMQGQLGGGYA